MHLPLPRSLFASLALVLPAAAQESPSNWPGWRGPHGNGTSEATGLPTTWSTEENVLWRAAMPSFSGATPIVWGERVFVMSPSAVSDEEKQRAKEQAAQGGRRGRRGGGRHPGGEELSLHCLDATNGSELWSAELDSGNKLWYKSNNASPSPVTDGKHVWATTGTGVLAAFDFGGERLWDLSLQAEYGSFGLNWGYASSPLLVDGKLFVQVLHGSHTDDPSYVLCIDGESGDVLWRVERPTDAPRESPDAYTTPLLVERDGKRQLVISGGDYVTGHDLASGEELWRVGGLNPRKAPNYRIVASPVLIDDLLVAPTRVRPLTAIALGDELAPTEDSIAWQWSRGGSPDVPTPTTDGRYLYLLDDGGMVTCVDPATGEAVWGPERTAQGTVSSSLVCADGKLYFTNEAGVTVVLAAGPEFELLATNELDGSFTLSSVAVAGKRLFLRTEAYLYCIGLE